MKFWSVGTSTVAVLGVVADMAGNRLGQSATFYPPAQPITAVDNWQEIDLTSFAVTASTDYLVGVHFLGNGEPRLRSRTSASGGSYYQSGLAWGAAYPAQFIFLTPTPYEFAIQLLATVEGGPPPVTSASVRTMAAGGKMLQH
jgi:hypothetical protein